MECNLFEIIGMICFEVEGCKDVFIGFCDFRGVDCVEFIGIIVVLFNGFNIVIFGDGLNFVNFMLGRELFRLFIECMWFDGVLILLRRCIWFVGVLWFLGRCMWFVGVLRWLGRLMWFVGELGWLGRCKWFGGVIFFNVWVGVG